MNVRLACSWLRDLFLSGRDVESREDAEDWLEGRDEQVMARRNERAMEAILLAGGKVVTG